MFPRIVVYPKVDRKAEIEKKNRSKNPSQSMYFEREPFPRYRLPSLKRNVCCPTCGTDIDTTKED